MKFLEKIVENRLKWEALRQDFGKRRTCFNGGGVMCNLYSSISILVSISSHAFFKQHATITSQEYKYAPF
jgi:hypothetical protein